VRFLYAITFVACLFAGVALAADPPLARLPDGATIRLGTTDFRAGGPTGSADGLATSPDGKQALTVNDTALQAWDLATGRVVGTARLPEATKLSAEAEARLRPYWKTITNRRAVWSPDGKSVVVPWHGLLFRYPIPLMGEPTRLPRIDDNTGVSQFAFAAPDDTLYALATDRTVRAFRPKTQDWVKIDFTAFDPNPRVQLSLLAGRDVVGVKTTLKNQDGIHLWDINTRKTMVAPVVPGVLRALNVSKDGKWLAASYNPVPPQKDGSKTVVGLWRLSDRKQVGSWNFANLSRIALAPDGSRLATLERVGNSGVYSVGVYDAVTGKKLQTMPLILSEALTHLTFTADSSQLLGFGPERVLHQWDVKTGKSANAEVGHLGTVSVVLALKDHRTLTGGRDGRIVLWDEVGKEVRRFLGHSSAVTALAISPDEKALYSASSDDSVRAWSLADGKQLTAKKFKTNFADQLGRSISLSPDGRTLAVAFINKVRLYSAGKLEEFATLEVPNAGEPLIPFDISGGAGKPPRTVFVRPGLEPKGEPDRVSNAHFLPDGRLVALYRSRTIRVWDVDKKSVVQTIARPNESRRRLNSPVLSWAAFAVSPDGKTVAVSYHPVEGLNQKPQMFVAFWDLATGKEVGRVEVVPGEAQLSTLAYSPDGRSVLAADGWYGHIWQVDVKAQKVTKTFNSGRHFPRCLAVYPDGKGFVSGGTDTTALVWKLDTK